VRKVIIIVSLVSLVFMSAGNILRILTNPAYLVWPTLPWLLSLLLVIPGLIGSVAALIMYGVYSYRQERAKEQQFKQWGLIVRTNMDLLRRPTEKFKPYQREVWLQLALFVSLGLCMLSTPIVNVILPQVVPFPSGPYTRVNYIKQKDYEKTFPQIETTFDLILFTGAPVSILLCTFLSKDLAKKSKIKSAKRSPLPPS
jgi:hypothetical protein